MSRTASTPSPLTFVTLRNYSRFFWRPLVIGSSALVILNILDVTLPLLVRGFLDALSTHAPQNAVIWCAVAYVSVAFMQCCCRFTWRFWLGRAGVAVATAVRGQAVGAAVHQPHRASAGDTVSVAHSDSENFARSFDGGVIITVDACTNIVTIPIILFSLNANLAWKVLLPLPFVSLLVAFLDGKVRERHRQVQQALSTMTRYGEEFISHARMIKVNTVENSCLGRFRVESEKYRNANRRLLTIESIYGPGLEAFISMGLVTLMVFGASSAASEVVTLGTFVAFYRYVEQLQWPMRATALAFSTFRKSHVSGGRVRDFIQKLGKAASEVRGAAVAVGDAPLCAISLGLPWTACAKKKTALIGPVGSGKTTLLRQIAGLQVVPRGVIHVGGVDVHDLSLAVLHSIVAMVPQESELFCITVRENLEMGLPSGESVDEGQLIEALRVVELYDEVIALPKGLDTIVGEGGVALSGGQRQRLSIARAILRRPRLLLLDNSFAAVDAEKEALVLSNLTKIGQAALCVTHRLSTVYGCDEVITLVDNELKSITAVADLTASAQGWTREFLDRQKKVLDIESAGNRMLEGT